MRDLALSGSGTRIIAVGKDAVRTIGFDGATLSVEDEEALSTEDSPSIQNRSVALAAGDSRAIVGGVKLGPNGRRSGGVTVYGVGTSGELSEQETLTFSEEVRVVRALHLP